MKINAVSLVKNECDIIELFVRINLRFVDHLFIIDNDSSDRTVEIILKLQQEGLPVTLWHDHSIDFQQNRITTNAVRKIFSEYGVDWVIPLDADEFITENRVKLRSELLDIPLGYCGKLEWKTFVPLTGNYFEHENPLWQNFRQRVTETRQFSKVIIPSALGATTSLTKGNHHLYDERNQKIPQYKLSSTLAHVPVRSSEQIISKSIIGSLKHQITYNRHPAEGFHKELMSEFVRKCGYSLDSNQLKEIVFTYSQKPDEKIIREIDNSARLGLENDCMVYRDISAINVLERFDHYMTALCEEIKSGNFQHKTISSLMKDVDSLKRSLHASVTSRIN